MRILVASLLLSSLAAAAESPARAFTGCQRYPADKRFRWGIRGEVGVPELVASVGEITCRTIVVSQAIVARGSRVSLEVPDLLTADEVFRLFQSALDAMGLTLEVTPRALKIVDSGAGPRVARTLAPDEGTPAGDGFVVRLLRVRHAAPSELAEALGRLRSKEGEVTAWPAGGALLLTDRAESVRRMEALARQLDAAPPGERIFCLGTHAAAPSELAAAVEKVLGATRRPAPAAQSGANGANGRLAEEIAALVPVDAARMLVVVGSDGGYAQVAKLAARIDPAPVDGGGGQAHVLYLAHTNAEEMAKTLATVGLSARTASPARPGAAPAAAAAASPSALFAGDVRIGADPVTNALLVFASAADFQTVRELVGKLDLPRRQVYVDAVVLDLATDRARDLGLSFHGGGAPSDGSAGFVSSGGQSVIVDTSAKPAAVQLSSLIGAGLSAGLFGKSFDIAGVSVPSLGVVLQALEHNRDVNVISRPHLLTMDNAKAELSVGQKIPFPVAATFAGSFGQQTSYQRMDVALRLDLTPHLNDSDSIRLEIDGEISDVADGSATAGGPITNQRTIKTAVVVGDGETVVLGGLQKESDTDSVDQVPVLGDIPVLGYLFKTRSKRRVKQDLLVILTPYIIRGPEDLRVIYARKEAERREFLERYTAFRDAPRRPLDWQRKRGLLEEINVEARRAEVEAQAIREAQRMLPRGPRDGVIE